jgi:hypothetical protein
VTAVSASVERYEAFWEVLCGVLRAIQLALGNLVDEQLKIRFRVGEALAQFGEFLCLRPSYH